MNDIVKQFRKQRKYYNGGIIRKFQDGGGIIENDLYNYLQALENPDNIGYNPKTKTWTRPPENKGYDTRQIGLGLDTKYNKEVSDFMTKNNRNYLSHTEMLGFMKSHLDYLESVLNRKLKDKKISKDKRMMALGMMYRGDSKYLWDKTSEVGKAFWGNSDSSFRDAITKFYGSNSRAKRHSDFYKNRKLQSLLEINPLIEDIQYPINTFNNYEA